MELLQGTGGSLQPLQYQLTEQDGICSVCSLIRPDPSLYWFIITLSQRKGNDFGRLRSQDPGDSPRFIFGLPGMEIGRRGLNQFPCVVSLAGSPGESGTVMMPL